LERLSTFSKSGLAFADPASDPEFASLKNSPEFETMLARLRAAREPRSASKPFLTLPERDVIAEDIAYDSIGDKFYVSSVRHRKILSLDKHGSSAEFVREGQADVWAILALGVDSKRRILWAATAALPEGIGYRKEDEGRSALLKYSLDTGELVKRYDLKNDTKHVLGDLTVSPAGDVFVSDGEGAVYWVEHKKDALDILVDKGMFRSPQTPALSPDGRTLFVPDYSRSIGMVDLATRQVKLLEHPKELSLGGIDGMYLSGRTLIAIQNGTAPERLIRMKLNDALTRVVEWETIEANWPELGDPTHGVIVGDQFYFIANSGWDRMADDGSVKPGATFEPATVRQMRLDAKSQSPR
jgi:sugar lactone lactonase YvrE